MHSRVGWWTDQSIEWFIRASRRTDYHALLCDRIEPYLASCRSIVELGCGLGYEAGILKQRGHCIQAYDINENVINLAKARTGLDIFHVLDATKTDASADAVLCINYGHIETSKDLDRLLSHADKKLVYVISRHNAHGADTREDRTGFVRSLITESGLPFEEESIALDFDQPLKSMDEARAFIEWTYLGKNTDRYLSFVEKKDDKKYPFVFRNRKENVLFCIEKRGLK